MKINPPIELHSTKIDRLEVGQYYNGTTAITLYCDDGEVYSSPSANLPESVGLEPGEFFLRDYSEHLSMATALIDNNIVELLLGKSRVKTGYVTVPVARLTKAFLEANHE